MVCMVAPYISEFRFSKSLGYDIKNYEAMSWWAFDETIGVSYSLPIRTP